MTQQDLTDYASGGGDSSTARYAPDTCIGFDVTAGFAHFRKVGTNSAKPSYRVPPRTTVAGLLAGIMGMPRDSYYDLFSPSSSALAVVPKKLPHTYTMGITTVNTKADDTIQYLPEEKHYTKSAEMLTPESYVKYDRQRDTYEMLVDPVYRVYVALADEGTFTTNYGNVSRPPDTTTRRHSASPSALPISETWIPTLSNRQPRTPSTPPRTTTPWSFPDPASRSSASGRRSTWRRPTAAGARPRSATSRTRLATTASR